MNDSIGKIACYVRCSTVGQNDIGQRREIQAWLRGNGIDPTTVLWFVDKDSGDHLQRPGFERLQQKIFEGKVKTVVCYKLDRLSRKLKDGITTICNWCEKGIRVVSVTQAIDFNGTVGKLIAAVLLGISEMEQELRRERQAVGIEAAKERGVYTGRKRGATKKGVDTAKAVSLRERGLSYKDIAQALGVSISSVRRYLKKED